MGTSANMMTTRHKELKIFFTNSLLNLLWLEIMNRHMPPLFHVRTYRALPGVHGRRKKMHRIEKNSINLREDQAKFFDAYRCK